MKKVLLSLAVVAALGMTSCGGADMCGCVTEMVEIGKKMKDADESEKDAIMKEFEAKEKECKAIGDKMEEGKSEEEIEKMKEDFMNNCEAVKEMKDL